MQTTSLDQEMQPSDNIFKSIFGLLWKILLFVVILLLIASHWMGDMLIFRPPPVSYVADYRYFAVETDKGEQVACRFLSNQTSRYLVIYSHGNAEDLGSIENLLKGYRQAGLNILSYDYPGYGISSGEASEASTYRAIEAVTRFAINRLHFAPDQIIFHGRSLGSGPAIEMCRRGEFAGLILESAFTSAYEVGLGIRWLPWDRYKNLKKIASINEPTFVIHGTEDRIVPFVDGQRLFERSPAPKLFYWVDGARHNDIIQYMGDEYWQILADFVRYIAQDL